MRGPGFECYFHHFLPVPPGSHSPQPRFPTLQPTEGGGARLPIAHEAAGSHECFIPVFISTSPEPITMRPLERVK